MKEVVTFKSVKKYAQIKHHLQAKSSNKLFKMVGDFDVRGQQGMDFFTGGKIMDSFKCLDLFLTNTQLFTSLSVN